MAGPTTGHVTTMAPSAAVAKYHAVVMDAAHSVATAGANAWIFGICLDEIDAADVTNGRQAAIQCTGIVRGIAGASVAAGALVTTNASGRLVTATTGQRVVGRALTAPTADGHHMDVQLLIGTTAP